MNKFPACVNEKIQQLRENGGAAICHEEEFSFLILALGRRRTGGYSIQIEDINYCDDKLLVYAREIKPGPSDIVTQAITYPVKVKKLPYSPLPLVVIWK